MVFCLAEQTKGKAIYIALILDLPNIMFICNSMCILKISIMRGDKEFLYSENDRIMGKIMCQHPFRDSFNGFRVSF